MPAIFRFFWFLCGTLMAINIVFWRGRLMTLVSRGVATPTEVNAFVGWATAWLVGCSFALGLIGLAANWSSPFCAGFLLFDTLPRILTSAVMLCGWAAVLWWVWRGNGAEFLGRVGPALSQRPSYDKTYSPRSVRAAVTGLVLISAIGAGVVWRTIPIPMNIACPINTVAG